VLVGNSFVAGSLLNAADLSIALLDRAPGDTVRLRVLRSGWSYGQQRELEIPITLRQKSGLNLSGACRVQGH
jgi:hypothetical protein